MSATRRFVTQFRKYTGPINPEQAAAGIRAAVQNARELLDEAGLLIAHKKWARGASLSILAIEEAGKVPLLRELLVVDSEQDLRSEEGLKVPDTFRLRLLYHGIERRVEPYSLAFKRRKDGVAREYFYAWDLSGGRSGQTGIKSFTAEKVQSIQMTDQSFVARFPIELAKVGGYFSKPYFATPTFRMTPSRRSSTAPAFAITYIVECPYCGKRFKRTKLDTGLNEHKDRYGNRCYGRVGTIV